ncbi:MAG TPA: hypothetical protein VFZ36_01580, partial [Vicinamibacterales bacterium]
MTNAYLEFSRDEWARLRAQTPLTLTEDDLSELQGINERVSMADVESIYLPLSRLLNLHVAATQTLQKAADTSPPRTSRPALPSSTTSGPSGQVCASACAGAAARADIRQITRSRIR